MTVLSAFTAIWKMQYLDILKNGLPTDRRRYGKTESISPSHFRWVFGFLSHLSGNEKWDTPFFIHGEKDQDWSWYILANQAMMFCIRC